MTKSFYTHVSTWGDNLLYRGVENGRRIRKRIPYRPTLYTRSKTPTTLTTLDGTFVEPIHPGTMKECKAYIETFKYVPGGEVYGNDKFNYAYLAEQYPDDVDWSIKDILVANIDIEVGSENGFPDPDFANEEITAITIKIRDQYHVFGCGVFTHSRLDVSYYKCKDEVELISIFLKFWCRHYPDAVTGWNCKTFDFPYIINRIKKIMGEETARKMSPWGNLMEREFTVMGRLQKFYDISGVVILDYLEIYRKFADKGASQESYKLNAIAHVELGEKKLSYEEYDNLHQLYRQNYQKFIEYNIQDVALVDKLDSKLGLIELVLTLAYEAKANYDDVLAQTRMWDALTYNHLIKQNIVFPPKKDNIKTHAYKGAYVKDPLVGMHHWVASFDLQSLYPHLIIFNNISPETLIEPREYPDWMRSFVSKNVIDVDNLLDEKIDTSLLKQHNITLTPNGQFFRKDKQGFLAKMMEDMYKERAVYKKKMIEEMKRLQEIEKELDKRKKDSTK